MAEGVFRDLVHKAGLEREFRIDSAGTSGYHAGDRAHRGTLKVLEKNGIAYDGRSRQLTFHDLQDFDYIVAMDNDNLADIKGMGEGRAEVSRLLDFAPNQPEREVPDPYYDDRFDHVYDLVLEGSKGLLAHISQQRQI